MSWLDIVKLIVLPVIAAKIPHGDKVAPLVVTGIEEAEALKDAKSGAEKLQHSVEVVNTLIDAHNSVAKTQIDKAAVNTSIQDGISTVVDVANLIHKKL